MKAAVMRGPKQIEIENIPTPEPKDGQIRIKIKFSAICGSDVHRFQFGMYKSGAIMGHEFIGVIDKIGPKVTTWKIGDRVVGGGGVPPVHTSKSEGARYSAKTVGFENPNWGGFAEFKVMDSWAPLKIPDDVSNDVALFAEPCSIAIHAVRESNFKLGDSSIIIGTGPIGLLLMQVLKSAGVSDLFVSEPSAIRAKAASKLGAKKVFNPNNDNVVDEIVSETDGLGIPLAFDCAAARNTLQQSLEMVKKNGQVVIVSLGWEEIPLKTVDWVGREIQMKASYGSNSKDWSTALKLMERGLIKTEAMLSKKSFVGFESLQESMIRLMDPRDDIQVVLVP